MVPIRISTIQRTFLLGLRAAAQLIIGLPDMQQGIQSKKKYLI